MIKMLPTFDDFLKENKKCSGLSDNLDAQEVFEILSTEVNIIKMLELCDQKQPALAACVAELKKWQDGNSGNNFPLRGAGKHSDFNKTVVGRMVKTILAPFGYTPYTRKTIPTKYGSTDFSSASCYKKTENASLMVKKMIVPTEQ